MKKIQIVGTVIFVLVLFISIASAARHNETVLHIVYPFWAVGMFLAFKGQQIPEIIKKVKKYLMKNAYVIA